MEFLIYTVARCNLNQLFLLEKVVTGIKKHAIKKPINFLKIFHRKHIYIYI